MNAKPIARDGLHEEVLKLFNEKKLKKNIKILDAACGEGALLSQIYKLGYEPLFGCDIVEGLRFKKINFKKCNLNENLPYASKSFDVIFSIESVEHLQNSWNLINEFHRVLKPGGLLILSTPNLDNWYQRIYYLLMGSFHGFETDPKLNIHIFPVFKWTLKKMIHNKFIIEKYAFGKSLVPILRVELPVRNFFLSEGYIVRMKKI